MADPVYAKLVRCVAESHSPDVVIWPGKGQADEVRGGSLKLIAVRRGESGGLVGSTLLGEVRDIAETDEVAACMCVRCDGPAKIEAPEVLHGWQSDVDEENDKYAKLVGDDSSIRICLVSLEREKQSHQPERHTYVGEVYSDTIALIAHG